MTQANPAATSTGWTRLTRAALSNDGLVRFREASVKRIVKVPLSSNLTVSSCKPAEMDSKNNFFNAIAQMSQASLQIASWCRTNCMHSVFIIVEKYEVTPATANAAAVEGVREVGDLFTMWNTVTLDQVFASCDLHMKHSDSPIEPQNLNLTWELMLANVDDDLRAAIIAEVSRFSLISPDAAQSGPMAFHIIANRIIRSTDALAHHVLTGLMSMGLIHFRGEDVIEAVAVIRNVLLFLACGTPRNRCPPTIMDILVDIFLRCSNVVFVTYICTTKDFHASSIDAPEKLFTLAQAKYNELIVKPNGWVRAVKNKAAFFTGELPELAAAMDEIEKEKSPMKAQTPPKSTTGCSGKETDRKGRVIDRTPPTDGVNKRKNPDGFWEFWCGRCPDGGRWGNHDESRHDTWRAEFKEAMKKKKAKQKADAEAAAASPPDAENPPSMHRANFCQPVFSSIRRNPPTFYDSDSSF